MMNFSFKTVENIILKNFHGTFKYGHIHQILKWARAGAADAIFKRQNNDIIIRT
jgi:hypothetical protein